MATSNGRMVTKLKTLVVKYSKQKAIADAEMEKATAIKQQMLDLMISSGITKTSAELEGGTVVYGTLVQGSTMTVNVDELKDMITPAQFKKISKSSVDLGKFRDAVASGEIDIETATAVTEETSNTPYIRFGDKEAKD